MKVLLLFALSLSAAFAHAMNEGVGLISPGAELRKLHGDFAFLEGPVADAEGNLLFSDIPSNRILKWTIEGQLKTVLEDSNGGNGLAFDSYGNLIICEELGKRISMLRPDGSLEVLAESYNGAPFNSPNDLWVDTRNGIYFTDPNYDDPDNLTQDSEQVYYIAPERSTVRRVTSDMQRPNGIITTAENDRLYVADTEYDQVFEYEIIDYGQLGSRRAFADTASDGITLDEQGNLYTAWGDGIKIYSPQGELIQIIPMPERPTNLAFGGSNHQTLFITVRRSLYAIDMAVKGVPKPL
jgi:gluconolactonase